MKKKQLEQYQELLTINIDDSSELVRLRFENKKGKIIDHFIIKDDIKNIINLLKKVENEMTSH